MKKLLLFALLLSGVVGSLRAVGPINFAVEEHTDSRCVPCKDHQTCIEGKCVTLFHPHSIYHSPHRGKTQSTSSGSAFAATRGSTEG
ncbi:hypothetical protein HOM50_01220 [bacterium]|nr:hypothetical protein [bacterium]MBT5015011.1 hypothetical protein [bacterium]